MSAGRPVSAITIGIGTTGGVIGTSVRNGKNVATVMNVAAGTGAIGHMAIIAILVMAAEASGSDSDTVEFFLALAAVVLPFRMLAAQSTLPQPSARLGWLL